MFKLWRLILWSWKAIWVTIVTNICTWSYVEAQRIDDQLASEDPDYERVLQVKDE